MGWQKLEMRYWLGTDVQSPRDRLRSLHLKDIKGFSAGKHKWGVGTEYLYLR